MAKKELDENRDGYIDKHLIPIIESETTPIVEDPTAIIWFQIITTVV